jgi:hypothetical protein
MSLSLSSPSQPKDKQEAVALVWFFRYCSWDLTGMKPAVSHILKVFYSGDILEVTGQTAAP